MHDDDRGYDYRARLFDLPLTEWSDDELRVGIVLVCGQRDAAEGAAAPTARQPQKTGPAGVCTGRGAPSGRG